MDLLKVVKSTKAPSQATANIPTSAANMVALNSDAIFDVIKQKVKDEPAKAKAVNAVFHYKITKNGDIAKEWSKWNDESKGQSSRSVSRMNDELA